MTRRIGELAPLEAMDALGGLPYTRARALLRVPGTGKFRLVVENTAELPGGAAR